MRRTDGRCGQPAHNPISRREAISLTSAALLAGCIGLDTRDAVAATPPKAVKFPKGAIIRTLLKDLPPASLASGAVLFHEHLSMKYPPTVKEHFTDDVDLMVEEVRAAGKDGISCIVDGGHADMTRNLDALKRIASESGVSIVASGGYYMQRTYPPEIAGKSADQIADELVREAREQRLGAFGEIGQQGGELTADEKKVFQAIAKAQVRSHLPIFTHNAYTGTRQTAAPIPTDAALRQLDLLEENGAKPEHIAIGHVCCLDEPSAATAIQIAKRGAFVGFDRVTIQGIISDEKRAAMFMKVVDAGFAERLLISSDFAVGTALKRRGGPGIGQAWTVFGPMLVKAGLPEETLRSIMIDNPRRFLAFVPA
jgi:phosphotriesterase-related protein